MTKRILSKRIYVFFVCLFLSNSKGQNPDDGCNDMLALYEQELVKCEHAWGNASLSDLARRGVPGGSPEAIKCYCGRMLVVHICCYGGVWWLDFLCVRVVVCMGVCVLCLTSLLCWCRPPLQLMLWRGARQPLKPLGPNLTV